eukprot:m.127835 g.127835  ORF g.127835 m.127835 type:complete len:68 (+) comp52274_c0_seq8:495-698(+)
MCYPVRCRKCGKTTYGGCGAHKKGVIESIECEERCTCNPEFAKFLYTGVSPPQDCSPCVDKAAQDAK